MANITVTGVKITDGPQDWQIFQRDRAGFAAIRLGGTWEADETEFYIQARVVDENLNMPVTAYLDWQDATLDLAAKRFSLTFEKVPQGGLYRLETRIKRPQAADPRPLRGDYIHHIGVGDIFVIAGQSNASGTGKGLVNDGPVLGVHLFANDERWKLAMHPLEDATNTLHPITITRIFHGHSPWLAFAKTIFLKTGIPVGLIPTALGGSPVSRWVEGGEGDGDLFKNMADMLQKAGGKTAGILWYQGETEVTQGTVGDYPRKFRLFVEAARALTGNPELPVFTGQLNAFVNEAADAAGWTRMREIQRELSHRLKNVFLVVTVDCPLSDPIHNSSGANVWIGERFALAALEAIYGKPIGARHPEVTGAAFTGTARQVVRLDFEGVGGGWTPDPSPAEFSAQDEDGWIEVATLNFGPDDSLLLGLNRPARGRTIVHGLYGLSPRPTLFDDNGRCIVPFSLTIEE